jgi:hypothetical protein
MQAGAHTEYGYLIENGDRNDLNAFIPSLSLRRFLS